VVPIIFTGDYKFPGGMYLGLGAGPYLINLGDVDVTAFGFGASAPLGKKTSFGVAPRVGVNKGKYDFMANLHLVDDGSFLNLTAGMLLGVK